MARIQYIFDAEDQLLYKSSTAPLVLTACRALLRAAFVHGLAGNDRITGTVAGGGDKFYGGAGADYLDGSSGDDRLNGGRGNDTIYDTSIRRAQGGPGNDTIDTNVWNWNPYSNNDLIELNGGTGADLFDITSMGLPWNGYHAERPTHVLESRTSRKARTT